MPGLQYRGGFIRIQGETSQRNTLFPPALRGIKGEKVTMGQLTKDEVFALAVQRYSDTVFRAAMHNCSCTAHTAREHSSVSSRAAGVPSGST